MKTGPEVKLPREIEEAFDRAKRLEWISFFLMVSGVILVYFTLGQSQAMKAIWVEDLLSLIPPLAFLISAKFRFRKPTERFPFGYNRSVSIGFLCSAATLLFLGGMILL